MKTFKDLEFKEHSFHTDGVQCVINFDNGYGASVVRTSFTYGGRQGLYELAVLDANGELTYDTPLTNDVFGYLNPQNVTNIMEKIQQL